MQKKEFQLTPSRRATGFPNVHGCYEAFQLTPSRRATDDVRKKVQNLSNFNSRPHGGRLRCSGAFRSWKYISTHALTEGDCNACGVVTAINIFQLTPSRRATCAASESYFGVIFQLTPSRRATFQTIIHPLHLLFQLTPSRRATLCTSSSVM